MDTTMDPSISHSVLDDDVVVASWRGEFDLASRELLQRLCTETVEQPARSLVVDLSAARFLDCGAVRCLATTIRTFDERHGTVVVVCPQPPLARMLALTGLVPACAVVPLMPEALERVRHRTPPRPRRRAG